jgi:predicted 3-demethylubiquinone-9 3-methyltransferase (glyoxalase superfamily)
MAKNTICLWYDKDAEAAARSYAEIFPDSAVGAIHRAPSDYPSGKKGDVLTVEFEVAGVSCIGLNGGPAFKHNEAFSFQIATEDQSETDRYWNAIGNNGGQESACGGEFACPLGPAVRLTARPPKRSFHLVFESHDGRALVPIPKRSTSP